MLIDVNSKDLVGKRIKTTKKIFHLDLKAEGVDRIQEDIVEGEVIKQQGRDFIIKTGDSKELLVDIKNMSDYAEIVN